MGIRSVQNVKHMQAGYFDSILKTTSDLSRCMYCLLRTFFPLYALWLSEFYFLFCSF